MSDRGSGLSSAAPRWATPAEGGDSFLRPAAVVARALGWRDLMGWQQLPFGQLGQTPFGRPYQGAF